MIEKTEMGRADQRPSSSLIGTGSESLLHPASPLRSLLWGSTALALFSTPAIGTGAIVSADLSRSGDGLLTLDTRSRLAWRQLEPTLGRSFFDVSGEFGKGGDFEGFRYATEQEFVTLVTNAGVLDFATLPTYRPQILGLQALLGISGVSGNTTFSLGMFSDASTGSFSRRAATLLTTDAIGRVTFNNQPNGPAPNLGSWLVRETAVPEPGSSALLLCATAAVITRQRTAPPRPFTL